MIPLIQASLPALAGLLMLWAGLVSLAGEGDGDLSARSLVRGDDGTLSEERTLHVIHLASLTLAAGIAGTATGWWAYPPALALIRVGLVTVLVWSIGDLAPRLLASVAPELLPHARRAALASKPIFAPLLWMATRLDHRHPNPMRANVLRPGAITPREMAMGVFSLKQMTVSEVMTPRIDIIAVDLSAEEDAVVSTLHQSEHARILVYEDNPDGVVGVIYAKDILPRLEPDASRQGDWRTLIRPAAFVPEAKTLERQLRDFQRGPGHLAVVVDEFGGTAGLVTLEDILEQIVGEIKDEHDVDEVEPMQHHPDGHLTVQGGVALVDLEAELGAAFGREDVATVGGLALAELGHVPRSGESFEFDNWRFVVELVIARRVRRVSVWPAAQDPVSVEEETAA